MSGGGGCPRKDLLSAAFSGNLLEADPMSATVGRMALPDPEALSLQVIQGCGDSGAVGGTEPNEGLLGIEFLAGHIVPQRLEDRAA